MIFKFLLVNVHKIYYIPYTITTVVVTYSAVLFNFSVGVIYLPRTVTVVPVALLISLSVGPLVNIPLINNEINYESIKLVSYF